MKKIMLLIFLVGVLNVSQAQRETFKVKGIVLGEDYCRVTVNYVNEEGLWDYVEFKDEGNQFKIELEMGFFYSIDFISESGTKTFIVDSLFGLTSNYYLEIDFSNKEECVRLKTMKKERGGYFINVKC